MVFLLIWKNLFNSRNCDAKILLVISWWSLQWRKSWEKWFICLSNFCPFWWWLNKWTTSILACFEFFSQPESIRFYVLILFQRKMRHLDAQWQPRSNKHIIAKVCCCSTGLYGIICNNIHSAKTDFLRCG